MASKMRFWLEFGWKPIVSFKLQLPFINFHIFISNIFFPRNSKRRFYLVFFSLLLCSFRLSSNNWSSNIDEYLVDKEMERFMCCCALQTYSVKCYWMYQKCTNWNKNYKAFTRSGNDHMCAMFWSFDGVDLVEIFLICLMFPYKSLACIAVIKLHHSEPEMTTLISEMFRFM